MRILPFLLAAAMTTGLAEAGSQSSNTSANSSSNNGILNERVVDTYCEDGYCESRVLRRTYRDGRHGSEGEWRRYFDHDD
jgi:hypothetical protein